MRFTERSASTISGSIRFRDIWAFPIHRGGMLARNLKNPRTAEPELDTKSLASRGIADRLRISNPRTPSPRNQDYCAYQSECTPLECHSQDLVQTVPFDLSRPRGRVARLASHDSLSLGRFFLLLIKRSPAKPIADSSPRNECFYRDVCAPG